MENGHISRTDRDRNHHHHHHRFIVRFFHARMGWTVRACTGWTVPQNAIWHLGIGAKFLRRMPFLTQPQFLAGGWLPYYHIHPGYMGGELCVRRDVQLPEWCTRQPPYT